MLAETGSWMIRPRDSNIELDIKVWKAFRNDDRRSMCIGPMLEF